MWRFFRTEFTPYWWVIPIGIRREPIYHRMDVEKEFDISVLCWHFRFYKYFK